MNEKEALEEAIGNLEKKLNDAEREKKQLQGDLRHLKLMLAKVDGMDWRAATTPRPSLRQQGLRGAPQSKPSQAESG